MTSLELRARAYALRDLLEATGDQEAILDLDGVLLTYSSENGWHLIPPEGAPLDVTEWVEFNDFWPVDGVVSVREQPVLMAGVAR